MRLARQNPSYAAAVTGAVAMLVFGDPADLLAAVIATLLATFAALSREDDQDSCAGAGLTNLPCLSFNAGPFDIPRRAISIF